MIYQYVVVDIDYIRKARSFFDNEYTFVTFSDDIEWCKNNIRFEKNDVFVENKTEIFDLYLMTLMDHNIISNSTFSWWGAYLNKNLEKKVISPRTWFRKKLKQIGYDASNDLIPDKWRLI